MRYALITGSGRSGTNWLLDMLDASPVTHCRNEPHGLSGTALHRFPLTWTSPDADDPAVYRARWDDVAHATARGYGQRDHHVRYPKPYLYPWANRGLSRLMTGPRTRRAWRHVDHGLRGIEWELPRYLGSRARLEASLGVLKILIDGPLTGWLVRERPGVPVVHIIRHPGGRLNSWLHRLVRHLDADGRVALHAHRVERMVMIAHHDPHWAALVPQPHTLSLVELELWFWRYVNETTWAAGRDHDSYLQLRFEDVAADPIGLAQTVFAHVGAPWSATVQSRIEADTVRSVFGAVGDSAAKATAWRDKLDAESLDALDRVVADSPLLDLLTR